MRKCVYSMGMMLILALAFASCKKTEEGKNENATFRASTAELASSERTFVGELGNDKYVMWTADDTIKVYTRTASPFSVEASLLVTDEGHKKDVSFYGNVRESDVYYAFYPAHSISNMGMDNIIRVTLPETQTYSPDGFANSTYPMWAYTNDIDRNFQFKSTYSLLGIRLKGNAKVGSIVLSSKSADEPMAGIVEIDASSFDTIGESYTFTEKKQSVTLNCGEQGVQLAENEVTTFYFVIPGQTYSGIKVEVKDLQGNKLGEKETGASHDPMLMAPATINYMDEFTVNSDEPTPGTQGYFTVNANGGKVVFAPGNLYYLPNATPKWQMAERHYSRLPHEPQLTNNQNVDRDLFGWGTSGYDNTANDPLAHHFHPWDIKGDWNWSPETNYNVHGFGPSANITSDIAGTNYDWGQYNAIYNPLTNQVDQAGTWRVLTGRPDGEWGYVLGKRTTQTNLGVQNARYAKATLKGVGDNNSDVKGVIIFPDVYSHPQDVAVPQGINSISASFSTNEYTSADWDKMDLQGAVFLPGGGRQDPNNGTFTYTTNVWYWTSSRYTDSEPGTAAVMVYFKEDGGDIYNQWDRRCDGLHVRLAKDVAK